ncbi:MAG: hypothetical protein PVS3B3_37020 [Ktedonobacteraceae bacterium]
MSGAYSVNAGGIFASGTISPATPDESDRHIHLMIYQLASYMNVKELGVPIQNAAKQVLGGDPNPGEIQATFVDSGDLPYFATDIRLTNLNDHTYAVGISPTKTDSGHSVPNPYVLDMQDLSIVLTVLQLSDVIFNHTANQPVFDAAFAALKVLSGHLNDRAENQGWKYS